MKVSKIVKASASWCGPCRQLEKELKGFNLVPIEAFDIDDDEARAEQLNVKSVPTLVFYDSEDKIIGRSIGYITKDQLIKLINDYENNS